jgi:hypothetical protein
MINSEKQTNEIILAHRSEVALRQLPAKDAQKARRFIEKLQSGQFKAQRWVSPRTGEEFSIGRASNDLRVIFKPEGDKIEVRDIVYIERLEWIKEIYRREAADAAAEKPLLPSGSPKLQE